jgi:hypothetical protein
MPERRLEDLNGRDDPWMPVAVRPGKFVIEKHKETHAVRWRPQGQAHAIVRDSQGRPTGRMDMKRLDWRDGLPPAEMDPPDPSTFPF